MLDDKQVVSLVNQEFDSSLGSPGGDISNERGEAWDYYLSKEFGNEEEDESKVRTSDVSDVVDGIMPSLLRLFTTADNLVSFDAVGPEDVTQAQQESDYVNYVFFKQNPAFEIMYFGMFDALVQKTGILKAWWDESEEVTTESYQGLSEDELLDLMGDDELEPVEKDEREDTVVTEDGVSRGTVTDITFRRITKKGRVRVENVPPEEYRISSDARSLDPSMARMVGHEREVTKDELLAMGFDKKIVDELSPESVTIGSSEADARKDKSDDRNEKKDSIDKSQDLVLLREAYQKMDVDGDGRAELMQIFVVGETLLSKEPVDRQPFHTLCPHPLPHKHFGRSVAEKVMDIQLVSSTILRQTLDNLYHTNKPGSAVWEQGIGENTMDDLLSKKTGSIARFSRPVGESYAPMTVPFTAGSSFPMLEYFDKAKRDRTGISSDSEGLSPDALKNIQTSVLAQSVDLSKMKVEAIARIFSETGFKTLFLHIHELTLKHQKDVELVELRNQFVQVRPAEWRSRKNMTVNIGLGIGTREQNLLHLNAIWEKQTQMVAGGGMNLTVTPKNIYNTAAELVKNANLKQPAMFFTDPGDQKAPPPADEAQELQKMQAEIELREQKLDQERLTFNLEKLKLTQQDLQLKHERETFKLQEGHEARLDKFSIENEKLKTQLAELSIAVQTAEAEAPLKKANAIADVKVKEAQAMKTAADADKVLNEIRSNVTPIDDSEEVAANLRKINAEIEKIEAETRKIEADTNKSQAEKDAQIIENDAAISGLKELAEDLGGSEETE